MHFIHLGTFRSGKFLPGPPKYKVLCIFTSSLTAHLHNVITIINYIKSLLAYTASLMLMQVYGLLFGIMHRIMRRTLGAYGLSRYQTQCPTQQPTIWTTRSHHN